MSIRNLFVLVVCACGSSSVPARKLTTAECTEAVDHAIALFEADAAYAPAAAQMREGRATFVAQCEATATPGDRDCLMKAKTAAELGTCPMPGARR
jgi:hypothetical protein